MSLLNKSLKRFAAIDIGSNAIRLLVTQITIVEGETVFKKLTLVRVPIRLGSDVFDNGVISDGKVELLVSALNGFSHLIKAYEVLELKACATSALREAKNGPEVISRIKQETGIEIEIITGKTEAAIIFSAGLSDSLDQDKTYLYIDVGGGSTELTLLAGGKIINSDSFKIGTVRSLFGKIEEEVWVKLRQWLTENIDGLEIDFAIGSGGNINKLVRLINDKKDKSISYQELELMHGQLAVLSIKDRMEQFKLNPDRADVIVPAASIFLNILKYANVNEIVAPKFGLADGLVRKLNETHTEK